MSSKNKTENLALNQWELDDVFQMEDFNSDNRKLDAAVAEARDEAVRRTGLPGVRLFDITLTQSTQVLDIDLADAIASGKYLEYWVFCPFDALMNLAGANDMLVMNSETGAWTDNTGPCRSRDGLFKFRVEKAVGYDNFYISGSRTFHVRPAAVGNSRVLKLYASSGKLRVGQRFIVLGLEL